MPKMEGGKDAGGDVPVSAALLGLRQCIRRLRVVGPSEAGPRLGRHPHKPGAEGRRQGQGRHTGSILVRDPLLPKIQEGMIEKCLGISA